MRSRKPGNSDHRPPGWAQRFIEWYCKPQLAEDLIGDLNEYFERNLKNKGPLRAKLIYIIDAVKFFRPYTVRAPKLLNLLFNWIMIGSYVKTSVRNVTRNKLFSTINIVGLAISMSVGLLLIAFEHDMLSYDRFNEKGKRIYRITSNAKYKSGHREKFATTSLKAGELIRERVSGLEETVNVRGEFAGDAKVADLVVPLTGLYADPSMLRIFTLPMLSGDAATALSRPYSIVLTETSAKKLFGSDDAIGKSIHIDTLDYEVTGILKDVPFFSHIQFESLVSYSSIESRIEKDPGLTKWSTVWQRNYIYLLLPEGSNKMDIQKQLDGICAAENMHDVEAEIQLSLLPLYDIVLGEELGHSIGPVMPGIVIWIIGGLALIVILSACFNYTNLSIARSMRRFKEIGLRKVIGARRSQVRLQFLSEAVIVSFVALLFSFVLFIILRPQFIGIAPELLKMVRLEITLPMALTFVVFAMSVGIVAGFLPALFFAKVNVINALRDASSVKIFRGLSFRRVLVVVQYTFTLIFITSTIIGYIQYRKILAFDLGFNTANILNIELEGNKPDELISKLKAIPEVVGISQSKIITSVGNAWGGFVKFKDSRDSSLVFNNIVDENYIPVHGYSLVAGQNFITRPVTEEATSEVIVNEKMLRLLNIANGDPQRAVGEEIFMNNHLLNKKFTIVGVIKDFHYGKLDEAIKPVVFTYLTPDAYIRQDRRDGVVNVRIETKDPVETLARIQSAWKSIDPVHPFNAEFYDDAIEDAYSELSAMIKVIGFLSFVAISIASLGLFGMVVFTTETRLKEMSIRKVLGASSSDLVMILSRGFMVMLAIAAVIALPVTWLFFQTMVLTRFPYHDPIGTWELFGGLLAVLTIAIIMIGSQAIGAAHRNPSDVLKCE
ncbi:ABC transporter permease [Chryseolinea sp. T2]|uniref:ABC transporter permease n=1 Tax=Chryseolinea sp. T2 TaxID=3129255 RepID=UPI003076E3FC